MLEDEERITRERRAQWDALYAALNEVETLRPLLPHALVDTGHNGHVFWLMARSRTERDELLRSLNEAGVPAAFHYQVLDGGRDVPEVRQHADRIVRLPVHRIEDVVGAVVRIVTSVERTVSEV